VEFFLTLLALMELLILFLVSFLLTDINYSVIECGILANFLLWTASRDPVDGVFDGYKPFQNKTSQPLI
jgi:hypothetical protein